jgi:RND family efflux transporter MFP subunit
MVVHALDALRPLPETRMSQPEHSSVSDLSRVAPVYSTADPLAQDLPSRRTLQLTAACVGIAALFILAAGLIIRSEEGTALRDWTDAQAIPTVAVAPPIVASSAATLTLPGRLEAYYRAPLYARVSGYLKSWKHDIGTQVKAGELLAEIEAPDLDQQLAQAQADLGTAEANLALAKSTAERWQSMLGTNAVSRQEVDEKSGDLAAKQALVKSASANVQRLRAEEGFTRIVAPFDGVVTARQTDVGQLIQAGGGGGPELFEVSDVHQLRVYVSVPQNYVPQVPPGTTASITVPERPSKTYLATVESSSQSVTAASGTTLMQLAVDNAQRELLPGGYAEVKLDLPRDTGTVSIPASALIFDAKGLTVAIVDANDHVQLRQVTVARDMGSTLEISAGLGPRDRVVQSPPDGLADGTLVRIAGSATPAMADRAHGKDRSDRG